MELTLTRQTPAQHIVWLDVVRLVAMFTVVCCHCTDPFNFYPGTSPHQQHCSCWGAVYGAALRPCVPLFVMITGALLLPVRGDASAFYKKRIPRVFFPFFIWSVIYNLFPWITGLLGVEPKVILDFFPYSGEEVMSIYKVKKSWLYTSARRNKIPMCRIAGKNYYSKRHIDVFFGTAVDIHSITEWVTADDVEEVFSMSKSALRAYTYRHKIPTKREYGRTYYSKEHLEELRRTDLMSDDNCQYLPYCESSPYQQGKSGCKKSAFEDGCGASNGRKGCKRTVISNDFIIIHQ